tara:strand:+ start:1510 stop:1935 length:426 start_codon:yes stop_codon:yes gene_type:complete
MRLIVNDKQYKRLIEQQNKENNFVNGWGLLIKDTILKRLENKTLSENIISLNKLNIKLGNKKFFNELPIDNLILNIYNESIDDFQSEWDEEETYLCESKHIKNVVLDITINGEKELNETINENYIKINLLKIKKWYENKNN